MKKTRDTQFSRPPLARMMWIHERLQAGTYPNCVSTARELNVAPSTVKRDVEFMLDRLELPIVYHRSRHGYAYSRPVDKFPSLSITEAELFSLLVAQKSIAQYHGTPYHQPLTMAYRKLTGQLDSETRYYLDNLQEAVTFRPFAPDEADLAAFEVITRGVQEQRALEFRYKNLGAKTAQARRVHPYRLACIENHWYLFGFDEQRQAIRTFSLSRLTAPKLTAQRITVPKDFSLETYLKGSFSVFRGDQDYEVVIDFDGWATDLVRGRLWHPRQEFTELPGGCSRLRLLLNSIAEVERWVLSWGTHADVVRPKALRERIRQVATELAARSVSE